MIERTRSISMVSKPFVFEVFVVKSVQAVTLSIIVLMCVTINDRTALKGEGVGDKSNACDVEKVETEPEEFEDKEFKED